MSPKQPRAHSLQLLITLCLSVMLSSDIYAAPKAKERGTYINGEQQLPQIRNKRGPGGRSGKEIDFQYRGKNHRMVLKPSSLRADTFRVTAIGNDGKPRTVLVAPSPLYKGYLADEPDAKVAVTLKGNRIRGYIKMADGEVIGIEPETNADNPMHRVYSGADIQEPEASCAVLDPVVSSAISSSASNPATTPVTQALTNPSTIYLAEIAFEADYEFFVQNGSSVSNTVLDIESILNGVNIIYENDVAIKHLITEIIVRETSGADPYTTSVASNLVDEIRLYWNANYNTGVNAISRDVAHLMTGRELVGSTIGIAYSGAICNISSFAYGLSQSRASNIYARRVALTAHELGHNWDASHCSCNIMCSSLGSCGGSLTSFSQTSINSIIAHRDTYSSCLDLTNSPPVAVDDSFAAIPNADTNLTVLANDLDPDGNAITISAVTAPQFGTTSINPDQTILYHSDALYTGTDQFQYIITDNVHGSDTGLVTVGVGQGLTYEYYVGNFSGIPNFNSLTADEEGTTLNVDLSKATADTDFAFRIRGELDVPTSGTYRFYLIADDQASLHLDNNQIRITGVGNPNTEYSVSLFVSQGLHDLEVRFYDNDTTNNFNSRLRLHWEGPSISKGPIPSANFPLYSANLSPVASNDSAYTVEDFPVSIQVLTNDFDPDGVSLLIDTNLTTANGTASVSGSAIYFNPATNYFGTTMINYTIRDSQGATNSASLEVVVDPDPDADSIGNLFDLDDDNDGQSDIEESIAGTSSTSAQSFFMTDVESGPSIEFMGLSGRLYQVQYKTNLNDTTWLDLGSEMSGQDLLIQVPATNSTDAAYYRVGVRLNL